MIISEKVTLDHLRIREEDGDVCPDNCFGRELLSLLWGFPTCLGTVGEAFLLRGHPDSVTVPSSPCSLRTPKGCGEAGSKICWISSALPHLLPSALAKLPSAQQPRAPPWSVWHLRRCIYGSVN